jgi:hypothetical protein
MGWRLYTYTVERDRGIKQAVVVLVTSCLIFGSSNSHALEQFPSGKHQVGATPFTLEMFTTKWKSMYQIQITEVSKLAGVPISQYKAKYELPKEPIFLEGNHQANEDALNDYAARIAAWFVMEKSSIEPKASTPESKGLPDPLKYSKENCEKLVKDLQNERVSYFNEIRVQSYAASGYSFREKLPTTICTDNDLEGNQKRYIELGATLKKWVGSEISTFSYSRLVFENLPSLNLVGRISTEEKFFDAIDSYRNSKESLRLMNSDSEKLDRYVDSQPKVVDVSYGYDHKIPAPRYPEYEPGNPSGNFASTVIWGHLYQKWVSGQLRTDDRLIFTRQVNPGQQKRQCEGQSAANTNSFTLIRSAIQASREAIQIQSANKDANDKKLNASDISSTLSDIRKALETYGEKLPIYFERDPSCEIYKVQISELQNLFTSLGSTQSQLSNLQNGSLRNISTYSERTFDRRLDLAIESTEKALLQKPSNTKAKVALPLICGNSKNSLRITHNGTRCPAGMTSRSI